MTPKRYCWRVWFHDGSAVLVDAYTPEEARKNAINVATDPDSRIKRVECLTE